MTLRNLQQTKVEQGICFIFASSILAGWGETVYQIRGLSFYELSSI